MLRRYAVSKRSNEIGGEIQKAVGGYQAMLIEVATKMLEVQQVRAADLRRDKLQVRQNKQRPSIAKCEVASEYRRLSLFTGVQTSVASQSRSNEVSGLAPHHSLWVYHWCPTPTTAWGLDDTIGIEGGQ